MDLQQVVELLNNLLSEGAHEVRQGRPRDGLERFQAAEALIAQVLEMLAEVAAAGTPIPDEAIRYFATQQATCLNNIGFVYDSQGDLTQALSYYQRALAIDQKVAPDSTQTATRLNNIGFVYDSQGDLTQALSYYQRALSLFEKVAPGSSQVASALNNIGFVYRSQGDLTQALSYYQRALAIDQKVAPDSTETATDLNNIGFVYRSQGDLTQALSYYQRALAIDQKVAPDSTETATDLNNIGGVYRSQGDLTQALSYYQRALAIDQKVAPDSTQTATRLNNIGGVYDSQGDLTQALSYYQRALSLFEKVAPGSSQVASALNNIGFVYQSQGDLTQALSYYQRAIRVVESLREKAGAETAAREGFFGRDESQNPYHGAIASYLQRYRDEANPEDATAAFTVAEKIRARSLLERMQRVTVRAETTEQQALLDREQTLLRKSLSAAFRLRNAPEDAQTPIRAEKDALEAELREIEGRIQQEIPGYAALQTPQTLSAEEVRTRLLDPGTLLLAFRALGEAGVVGWALRENAVPDGIAFFGVGSTGDINRISRIVTSVFNTTHLARLKKVLDAETDAAKREELQKRYDEGLQDLTLEAQHGAELWGALSKLLLNSVRPELWQDVTRLIVLPDGNLNQVPFELLPLPDALRETEIGRRAAERAQEDGAEGDLTLGDAFEITYAPSASALARLRNLWDNRPGPSQDAPAFLGFGDPDFRVGDDSAGNSRAAANPLPGTGDEVRAIASHFPGAIAFFGPDVTRENISPCLDDAALLHGATHGLLDNDDPLGSGLMLTGGEIWQAREFLGRRHPLLLELMVASACDTGRGAARPGEGLVGFSAVLMAVGVRVAVVSLWPVDDNATNHFMQAFYRYWVRTRSVSVALRKARAYVRRHFSGDYTHPYFWAAFVAFGLPDRPRPVSSKAG